VAILYQAPTGRARRHAALAVAALAVGVALAWLLRPGLPANSPTRPAGAVAAVNAAGMRPATAIDTGCDARCTVAKVIVPAAAACAASVEDLAGFGVRWLDADSTTARFDRVAWLEAARGTVTLGGGRAEFRNAAGAYLPVDYDCDFDPATLAVLEARARPRASTPVAAAGPTTGALTSR
jgi:hypothetical protein